MRTLSSRWVCHEQDVFSTCSRRVRMKHGTFAALKDALIIRRKEKGAAGVMERMANFDQLLCTNKRARNLPLLKTTTQSACFAIIALMRQQEEVVTHPRKTVILKRNLLHLDQSTMRLLQLYL